MSCPVNPLTFPCGDSESNKPQYDHVEEPYFVNSREHDMLLHSTPEPHFIPGYTGHTPGYIDKRLGRTYANYVNDVLTNHRVAGSRLNKLPSDYNINILQSPSQRFESNPYETGQPRFGGRSQPRFEGNPHETSQPHFVPGYTGFTPYSGVKRSEGIGETYGRMTHIMLAKHPLHGGRLRPVANYPAENVANEEDVKFYCYEHELTRDDIRRRKDQVPGYTGHMPRAIFRHGKTRTKIAEESIAEFQKIINRRR